MTPEQIRQNMLGNSTHAEARQIELQLAARSDIAAEAANVEPDEFVRKLRQQLRPAIQSSRHVNHASGANMNQPKPDALPPVTELESNEEIERVRAELRHREASGKSATMARQEQPYRPTVRPPAAILIMCDDGENSGEVFRLRADRFIIGRTEGDLLLPDDEQISSRHVALTRQVISGEARWVVTDLQSRNGLFVRVSKAPLAHLSKVLVGGGRYRLDIMQQAAAETAAFADISMRAPTTRGFDQKMPLGSEMLTELLAGGAGARIVLNRDQYWIGSDPDCDICRSEDPFVSDKHTCLVRSSKGTWVIKNNNTVNGIWLRMPQIVLEQGKKCEFQIGEQRFRLRYGVPL